MSWEQQISEKLQELQSISVRYDVEQALSDAEKTRARNNIAIGSSATNVSGNDYKISINN